MTLAAIRLYCDLLYVRSVLGNPNVDFNGVSCFLAENCFDIKANQDKQLPV